MTPRGRWMALPGLVGLFLGVLRGQAEMSLLSLMDWEVELSLTSVHKLCANLYLKLQKHFNAVLMQKLRTFSD